MLFGRKCHACEAVCGAAPFCRLRSNATVAISGVPVSLSSFANADILPIRVASTLAAIECSSIGPNALW